MIYWYFVSDILFVILVIIAPAKSMLEPHTIQEMSKKFHKNFLGDFFFIRLIGKFLHLQLTIYLLINL